MPRPGFEPGLLRPQRSVLTTRRSRRATEEVIVNRVTIIGTICHMKSFYNRLAHLPHLIAILIFFLWLNTRTATADIVLISVASTPYLPDIRHGAALGRKLRSSLKINISWYNYAEDWKTKQNCGGEKEGIRWEVHEMVVEKKEEKEKVDGGKIVKKNHVWQIYEIHNDVRPLPQWLAVIV